jgi:phosphatidylglycerophosphate synthase|mmetsp:Transcript_17966/g.21536  ORF Transcript_17966/g.21536 Transcript_17966/m.21536 type:complete len:408 (+) Transcript_17966:195-1418(+)
MSELFKSIFDVINAVVEMYLGSVIKPFLTLHEQFYSKMNSTLRQVLDDNNVPVWFTANFITYARTALVVPTVLLLSWGHTVLPSLLVLLVDFGDFLDGVVARYWVDMKKKKEDEGTSKDSKSPSPVGSDDDSYEVVMTGSPQTFISWTMNGRKKAYGGFVDAVCDKAYVVPCWLCLMSAAGTSSHLRILQYITLWCLILAESSSTVIRFRAFFTASGISTPTVQGLDFSTSAVKADHIGKAKQTFEMVGTALFMLPVLQYLGLLLLFCAVPLAYESVRRKVKSRVLYVDGMASMTSTGEVVFDHRTLKFWMQIKSLGSKLIVGVPVKSDDMVLNACASPSVDEVVAEAPRKVDLMFLEKNKIDFVVTVPGQERLVTEEVIGSNRCLMMMEDGKTVQAVKPKEPAKQE